MNLFRSLPKPVVKATDPEEEEQPFMDPQWTHLVLIYELLLRVVCTFSCLCWRTSGVLTSFERMCFAAPLLAFCNGVDWFPWLCL